MGVRSTRVRTIVCTHWISSLRGLHPWPTRGPSQTSLLLMFILHRYTVVPIETCMGPRLDSSQCVNIIRHSADANPQSRTRIYGRQAMCIPMSLSPNSRVTVLSYQYRSKYFPRFQIRIHWTLLTYSTSPLSSFLKPRFSSLTPPPPAPPLFTPRPSPLTLHPSPFTPHPLPLTLHLSSFTLHPFP